MRGREREECGSEASDGSDGNARRRATEGEEELYSVDQEDEIGVGKGGTELSDEICETPTEYAYVNLTGGDSPRVESGEERDTTDEIMETGKRRRGRPRGALGRKKRKIHCVRSLMDCWGPGKRKKGYKGGSSERSRRAVEEVTNASTWKDEHLEKTENKQLENWEEKWEIKIRGVVERVVERAVENMMNRSVQRQGYKGGDRKGDEEEDLIPRGKVEELLIKEQAKWREKVIQQEVIIERLQQEKEHMTPLPCRCENMNAIIKDLLGEAEVWKMATYRDRAILEEERNGYEETIRKMGDELKALTSNRNTSDAFVPDAEKEEDNNNNNNGMASVYVERESGDHNNREPSDGGEFEEVVSRRRKKGRRPGGERRPTGGEKHYREGYEGNEERRPDALTAGEWEFEKTERAKRKRNIKVRGVGNGGSEIRKAQEITGILEDWLGIDPQIIKVQRLGGGPVVTCRSAETKKELMRRKRQLKGSWVWLEDDLTPREIEIRDWLRSKAEAEQKRGNSVAIGYMKIRINGVWWRWMEREGRLEEMFFREERRRLPERRHVEHRWMGENPEDRQISQRF